MKYETIAQFLKAAAPDTRENDFIIACLKEAVNYCKQQHSESDIDWLPSASEFGLSEAAKFDMLLAYLEDFDFSN